MISEQVVGFDPNQNRGRFILVKGGILYVDQSSTDLGLLREHNIPREDIAFSGIYRRDDGFVALSNVSGKDEYRSQVVDALTKAYGLKRD